MTVDDKRRLPFFIVTKPACDVLGSSFTGRRVPIARSIYFALVRLANDARSDTVTATRRAIAVEAGVNVRVVDEYTAALEQCGLMRVERVVTDGVHLPNRWTLVDPPCASATGGDPACTTLAIQDREGGDPACTLKEKKRDYVPQEDEEEPRADARRPVAYRGRHVPAGVVAHAEQLCDVFADATGKPCPSRRRDGHATPALKQIVGALMLREGVAVDTWEAAIRRTVANPPGWTGGRPLVIGDVFGERAAEHALAAATAGPAGTRPGRPGSAPRPVSSRNDLSYLDDGLEAA